jgi:hypothetical protein
MVATPTRINRRTRAKLDIAWEKLPHDFVLPDDPLDNINQPPLASALTESLDLSGYLSQSAFTCSNYGLCANLAGKTIVKAPDWAWVMATKVPRKDIVRSYTPYLEGDVPVIVMEFLSYTEGSEYSIKSSYPPGKWFYYEQVLQVPNYVIFNPDDGTLEVFSLNDEGSNERSNEGTYKVVMPNEDGLYLIADVNLFLGLWQGTHLDRTGYWLRWWDADGQMLLWGSELAEQEKEKAEQEREKAIAKLILLGLSVDQIADTLSLSVSDVQQRLQQ